MPLPSSWVTAARAPVVNYPLPEPWVVRYSDVFRFGEVSIVRSLTVGAPYIINRSGFRLIDLEMHILHVHDVALIDRIS
jgi:hypothetical protein